MFVCPSVRRQTFQVHFILSRRSPFPPLLSPPSSSSGVLAVLQDDDGLFAEKRTGAIQAESECRGLSSSGAVSSHEVQSVVFRFGFLFASSPSTKNWNCHHCHLGRHSPWSPAASWVICSIFFFFFYLLLSGGFLFSGSYISFFSFLSYFLIPKHCERP